MKYRVTCLSPLLVGDGRKLSPIDYMVWKDQVNVLDQRRIFTLLSKGPRLDSYLAQLKRADKLDFASWGGFAQNFAGRRIPFEDPACTAHWERARTENLGIPTFAAGPDGPYLPGSAVKGALRTAVLFASLEESGLKRIAAQFQGDRPPRRPAELAEAEKLGLGGASRMRVIRAQDSVVLPSASLKVYMLRVATLVAKGKGKPELGWKQSPRGAVDGKRPDEGTPIFAEMAQTGTVFEGRWQENDFLVKPEVSQSLRWGEPLSRRRIFGAANDYAAELLAVHKWYAEWTGMSLVLESIEKLEARLSELREGNEACLLSIGWGGGLLGKIAWLATDHTSYREIIRQSPLYGSGIHPALPFPKTRRIIFLKNRPAVLPGFAALEIVEP